MPIFKPFRAVRPQTEFVGCFPTKPITGLSEEEIFQKSQEKSSYVEMIKPYVVSKSKDVDRNLRRVRNNFESLLAKKTLVQDSAAYYLYEQIMADKRVFRGLMGLTAVQDFLDGKIKKHEATIPQRKQKLAHYLEKTGIQAEPVLLTYNSSPKVEMLMSHEEKNVPLVNYTAEDGTRHKIWRIDNRLKMQQLKEAFEQVDAFYIADGHHRIGSAALTAGALREKNKKCSGQEGFNYVFSFVVSKDSIKIHDYNRLLKNLGGITPEEFLQKLQNAFRIHEKGDTAYFPSKKFHISMYLGGKFYSLHVKHELRDTGVDDSNLDHSFLEKYVFNDILGIQKESTSDIITYVPGNSTMEGIQYLKKMVDSGEYIVGFGLYPVSFGDLVKVSDRNIKMPPKCTFIEPKLITALMMYDMK